MYKFRSMVVNAEEIKEKLAHQNEMSGPMSVSYTHLDVYKRQ